MRECIVLLLMFFLACLSCKNQMDTDKQTGEEDQLEIECLKDDDDLNAIELDHLEGTKWKLVDIRGIDESGCMQLRELEPKNCEDCFTLTFVTDYIADVRQIEFRYKIDLLSNADKTPRTIPQCTDMAVEEYLGEDIYLSGGDFNCYLRAVTSHTATHDKLKIYYYFSYNYCLLFKRILP